jgi:superfamily II DNA or RNA helicase
MPLLGGTPLQRLQQGQATENVSWAIHKQQRIWGDPDSGSVTTYLSINQMKLRALDSRYGAILGFLWDQLTAGLPEPLAVFLGKEADAAFYIHQIDRRPRVIFVQPNEVPSVSSFVCLGHPGPEPVPMAGRLGRSTTITVVSPTCRLGLLQGVREALYANPVSGYAGTAIDPANLSVERLRAFDRALEPARPTKRSPSSKAPALNHWQGLPVPKACRVVTRAVLQAIDAQVTISVHEVHRVAEAAACQKHPDADLGPLLSNTILVTPSGKANLRLTVEGQRAADDLAAHSKRFRYSPALRRSSTIYAWQGEALEAWARHGRFGVIEAVTGTGKTRVGVEAAAEAIQDDIKVVVCVPTLVLLDQWHRVLTTAGIKRVGRVGGGEHDTFCNNDVLVGTVQSLSKSQEILRFDGKFMLIADECHRDGAPTFQSALNPRYVRRLGLTATFERADDRLRDLSAFFESSPVFEIGYKRAVPEGIVAHYVVARVGVDFTNAERQEYDEANAVCRDSRWRLIQAGLPQEPFGKFMEATAAAASDDGDIAIEARRYLEAFSRRVEILSLAQGKVEAVRALAAVVRSSHGALLFTMRVAGAKRAAALLNEQGAKALAISGESSHEEREQALTALREGDVHALAAPRILDEGVDVPEADLAVIIATSSSRLQLIQRMGRVLRLKKGGRRARFVLLYVRETAEDPTAEGGAHEAFFDAITPTADSIADFLPEQDEALCQFLTVGASPERRLEITTTPHGFVNAHIGSAIALVPDVRKGHEL